MPTAEERLAAELVASQAHIAQLERDMAQLMSASQDSNADDEHDPEGATIAFERQQLQAVLDHARRTRRELGAAAELAAAGHYGICETCGRPIDPERLEARPQATRCIICA